MAKIHVAKLSQRRSIITCAGPTQIDAQTRRYSGILTLTEAVVPPGESTTRSVLIGS